MKKVLVIGSTCVDVIIRVDHLPVTEENIHPHSQRFAIGGCAYNVANILGRGGADLTFVTPVGRQGVFGGFVRDHLGSLGFADFIDLPDAQNGCCYCYVEAGGERTFVSVHGAEYTFDPAWMARFDDQHFDYVYVCGLEIEEYTGEKLVSWLEEAYGAGRIGTVVYAPGPRGMRVRPELTQRLFALHPLLHLNCGEAMAMSGKTAVADALSSLRAACGGVVVATAGSEGVHYMDETGMHTVPGVPAEKIVDTIGAGDSHCGAMLLGLCRGMTLDRSLAMANRVSRAVVMTDGATLSDGDLFSALRV
ncbi:MAG: carbohydrate kinase family protein [Clostridia bacterium]|nr:carbohydrate kinase family protein [Clostridia bacterium]